MDDYLEVDWAPWFFEGQELIDHCKDGPPCRNCEHWRPVTSLTDLGYQTKCCDVNGGPLQDFSCYVPEGAGGDDD